MNQMLMKIQVGPVQEFIAQARSTRDMWAGSYLLSWLTASSMRVFKDAGCDFVFPTLEGQPLYGLFNRDLSGGEKGLVPTLPNVFMLLVDEDRVKVLADEAQNALKDELKTIGDACWSQMVKLGASNDWKARWDEQLEQFPVFNWSAVSTSGDWKNDVERLGKEMAARRNTREFDPWRGVAGASKDVLSGKEEIIGDEAFWEKDVWKEAGPFGAMNTIKRLFPSAVLEKEYGDWRSFWENMRVENTRDLSLANKDPDNPYIAVLAMDGDKMGAALKKLETKEAHTEFSETLAQFSEIEVAPVVRNVGGHLIYAGGDDVLAMCPADAALDLAKTLADTFRNCMVKYKLDSSCGIAIGHYQFPLQRIVHEARKAEKRAKSDRARAAFAMTLLKRSGEIIHWGGKWGSKALSVYDDFTEKSRGDDAVFSGRFPYALAELLQPYRLSEPPEVDMKPIIKKEFRHVQERQAQKKGTEVADALDYLDELSQDQLEDFPNLFLASAFMNRQRGEN